MNGTEAISHSLCKKFLAESVRSWVCLFQWSFAGFHQLRVWWRFPWIFHKLLQIQYFGSTHLWVWTVISDCVVFEIHCVWKDSRSYLSNMCRSILAKTPWKWCCSYLWFWNGTFTGVRMMHVKVKGMWNQPSDLGLLGKLFFSGKPPNSAILFRLQEVLILQNGCLQTVTSAKFFLTAFFQLACTEQGCRCPHPLLVYRCCSGKCHCSNVHQKCHSREPFARSAGQLEISHLAVDQM